MLLWDKKHVIQIRPSGDLDTLSFPILGYPLLKMITLLYVFLLDIKFNEY